jgi:hypothetical protein
MDFFTSTRVLEWIAHKRAEHYANNPTMLPLSPASAARKPVEVTHTTAGPVVQPPSKPGFYIFSLGGLISFAIGIIIGIVAVYLSWTCNTAMQYNFALKVFFAIFAYLFGLIYIILYIIMRYDTCSYIKRTNYF